VLKTAKVGNGMEDPEDDLWRDCRSKSAEDDDDDAMEDTEDVVAKLKHGCLWRICSCRGFSVEVWKGRDGVDSEVSTEDCDEDCCDEDSYSYAWRWRCFLHTRRRAGVPLRVK